MSYKDEANKQRELNVSVAWDRNSGDNTLDYKPGFQVSQTKFASYKVQTITP
jgi:hypothetical protein